MKFLMLKPHELRVNVHFTLAANFNINSTLKFNHLTLSLNDLTLTLASHFNWKVMKIILITDFTIEFLPNSLKFFDQREIYR